MKQLAIICSLALVGAGFYYAIFINNAAGVIPMIVGTLAFLTIATTKEKGKVVRMNNDLYERSE